jgi:molybdopterin-containing oxidoreductase family iron-sulfur binding subunit
MSKKVWKDLAQMNSEQGADEFNADIAQALAHLRSSHGLSDASCQTEGNKPENRVDVGPIADEFRNELHMALPGVNRRGFLQLTGAAAVFALTGCWHKDPDTLVPYFQQPEGTTIGKAVFYSSVLRDCGRATSVLVKTYDGRPIKLEGNPDHPATRGRLDAQTQAALLNLYDPDRQQKGPVKKTGLSEVAIAWSDLDKDVGVALRVGGIGLITGPVNGLASRQLIEDLKAAFKDRLQHAAYDPYAADAAVAARSVCFGAEQAKPPTYHVDRADVLVALGSDFLGGGQTGLVDQIAFGDFRRLKNAGTDHATSGQTICFEPTLSQTGMSADIRVRASMDKMASIAWAIAAKVAAQLGKPMPPGAPKVDEAALGLKLIEAGDHGVSPIAFTADALIAASKAGRNSLVYVGGAAHCGDNSLPLHVAANYLNYILGNEGVTVEIASNPGSEIPASVARTKQILADAAAGLISTLIISGVNPAFTLAGAAELIAKAKTVVVLSDRADETFDAAQSGYLAPTLHGLESWGDAETGDGIHSLQQPCIQPLWDCRAAEESLMAVAVAALTINPPKSFQAPVVADLPKKLAVASQKPLWQAAAHGVLSWQTYVQNAWIGTLKPQTRTLANDQSFWNSALAVGVVSLRNRSNTEAVTFNAEAVRQFQPAPAPAGDFQLVLSASRVMRDGANLNNAWLQETPDPVSKVTWDNYLSVSVGDRDKLGIKLPRYETNDQNPVARVTANGKTFDVPVHVQEGQDPGTVELFLGWGRTKAGKVAEVAGVDGSGGINAFSLVGAKNEHWGTAAQIEILGSTYRLATTQGHNTMEGRDLALDDVLELHRKDAAFHGRHTHRDMWTVGNDGKQAGRLSLWQSTHQYPGRRWGMVVDLNSCIGCQACIVACTAENNVPVVGRDEIRRGREMHWIRIDRYYSSNDSQFLDVDVIQQPVMCLHCENAPCEEVCPAMATMHNDEGVNVQIYNRCIGTRYCGNNCPYKVRRFNFYEYSKYRMGPVNTAEPFMRVMKNLKSEGQTSSSDELSRAPLQMLLNPVVSVRSKGVMEKCNFCVQRTRDIREQEKATNTNFKDGAAKTACSQTCPTGAITFGDINDPHSEVFKLGSESPHVYKMLDVELNTRPAVAFLRRVRNRPATNEEAAHLNHGGHEAAHGAGRAGGAQGPHEGEAH